MRSKSRQPLDRFTPMPLHSKCRRSTRRQASVSCTFRRVRDRSIVPERVLTVRLDGSAEYQTSDGDERRVPAGSFVLFEDVYGKGHKSRHSPEEQTVIWISLPQGLDNP